MVKLRRKRQCSSACSKPAVRGLAGTASKSKTTCRKKNYIGNCSRRCTSGAPECRGLPKQCHEHRRRAQKAVCHSARGRKQKRARRAAAASVLSPAVPPYGARRVHTAFREAIRRRPRLTKSGATTPLSMRVPTSSWHHFQYAFATVGFQP